MPAHDFKTFSQGFKFVFVGHPVAEIIYGDSMKVDAFSGFRFTDAFHSPVIVGRKPIGGVV